MHTKRSYWIDSLLLLGLCLLFFWRDLTPALVDRWAFAAGDFTDHFYAFARYKAMRLQNGQLPLWNPYTFAGHPFLADIQSAVFYPLSLLTVLLTSFTGFFYRALEWEALAHYPLAAIFTYLLARRLTRSRTGGLTAAIVFTFSGYLTSYPPLQLAILETVVWLPLIWLLLEVAAGRLETGANAAASRWIVAAALILGVALLAGHPQSGMLVAYASLAYGLYRLWPRPLAWRWPTWRQPLGLLALFGAIGLGTAAVQVIPSGEFLVRSTRANLGFTSLGQGFTTYDLLQLIYPQIGGRFPALYLGILPLGLVTLALLTVRCDQDEPAQARRTITFLGWGLLLAVLLSFGASIGLYFVTYLFVPGWKLFRGQERTVVWVVFAAALLAGYGAAWLHHRWAAQRAGVAPVLSTSWLGQRLPDAFGTPEKALATGFVLGALAALALALVFWVGYLTGHEGLWGFTAASLALALFLMLSSVATRSSRISLVLAVITLDVFTYNPAHHAGPMAQPDLEQYRAFLSLPAADPNLLRMINEDALPSNYGMLYQLEDLGGASPLRLAAYQEFLARVPALRAYQLLNVKYVLSWRDFLQVPAERLVEMTGPENKPIYLYRLVKTGPRAWLAGEVIVAPDREQAWQQLTAAEFDPVRQVVLPALPTGFTPDPACTGQIAWQERMPERLVLSVTVDQACILVLSELFYPGWLATVDNAATPILQANVILRAVPLLPGQHEVSFVYRPTSVLLGELISLTTVVAALVWLVAGPRVQRL